jgi:3-methyladenine DNA glycosylase AlkD
MNHQTLAAELEANQNTEKAEQMSAYMRDQFAFLGIATPVRKAICAPYYKQAKSEASVDWDFVNNFWQKPEREYQYVVLGYLSVLQGALTPKDVPKLKKLATTKSWWDTIDGLDKIVGNIALSYPQVNKTLLAWSVDKNFWLRRIAIDHQLSRKSQTNTELLEQIIANNLGQKEFFINKAIGWSLREYSKTNPDWVRGFITKYRAELAPLSIKEASKYI